MKYRDGIIIDFNGCSITSKIDILQNLNQIGFRWNSGNTMQSFVYFDRKYLNIRDQGCRNITSDISLYSSTPKIHYRYVNLICSISHNKFQFLIIATSLKGLLI